MSTAAATIPGRRENYTNVTRRVQIPKRHTDYPGKPRQKADIRRNSESELDRIKGDIHRTWGKGEGFSYLFTESGERKPWQPGDSKDHVAQAPPSTNTLTLRPLNEKRRQSNARIEKIHDGAKAQKTAYERFLNKSNSKKTSAQPLVRSSSDSNTETSRGVITVTKDYDAMLEERLEMLEMHNSFKKRIKKLEQENADVLENFHALKEENKQLRMKLKTGDDDPVIESYQRIYEDRSILRKAEDGYKSRIRLLEHELTEQQKECGKHTEELARLKKKTTITSEEERNISKITQLENEGKRLKAENDRLKEKLKFYEIKEAREKRVKEDGQTEDLEFRRWKKRLEPVLPKLSTENASKPVDQVVYKTVPLAMYTSRSEPNDTNIGVKNVKYRYKHSEMADLRNMLPDIY